MIITVRIILLLSCICVCYTINSPIFPSLSSDIKSSHDNNVPTPSTLYFPQKLDHFNYRTTNMYWKQRYLVNTDYWNADENGPIFFYTGNESPVTDYWYNSGFITEVLAPQYNAMILMMEHRYFGESMPFGNQSFTNDHIGYLSPEQALADYAYFLTEFKKSMNATKSPIILFGGSYGGMLTTWFRYKYPHIAIGGLAASAPFGFASSGLSPYTFMDTCQQTYAAAGIDCDLELGNALKLLNKLGQTSAGLSNISHSFNTCSPLKNVNPLLEWIEAGLVNIAMLDYPYATNYGIELPGWPVNMTCTRYHQYVKEYQDPIAALSYAMKVYSGNVTCLNTTTDVPDWGGANGAWGYLACTEMYLTSAAAQRGMWFPQTTLNLSAAVEDCKKQYNVTLDYNWASINFGGFNIKSITNIIFSNGLLDPWHTSGILSTSGFNDDSVHAIRIPEAAHHLDLRGPNEQDPIYVKQARQKENDIIGSWLDNYKKSLK